MAPMKAMKGKATKGTAMTATAVYQSVAETTGLKSKDVKAAVEAIRGVEKEWILQARRDAQHEAEEEACHSCPQGCEPVHKRALCLQGEACLENSEGFRHGEAQGGHQLIYGGADSQEGNASACSDAQSRCVARVCLISSWSFMGSVV